MTDLILREFNGKSIRQRESDGYINLTDMAKACDKKFDDWDRLDTTKNLISVISHNYGISRDILITSKQYHGTYAHRKVAIAFATWCSPEFFSVVIDWTDEILTKGYAIVKTDDETLAKLQLEVAELQAKNTHKDGQIQKLQSKCIGLKSRSDKILQVTALSINAWHLQLVTMMPNNMYIDHDCCKLEISFHSTFKDNKVEGKRVRGMGTRSADYNLYQISDLVVATRVYFQERFERLGKTGMLPAFEDLAKTLLG